VSATRLSVAVAAVLAAILALYLVCLPSTVQWGDSGELAAAAAQLTVAHPPGYPLFTLLGHLFLAMASPGAVFWRMALLNALLMVSALGLVAWPWRGDRTPVGLTARVGVLLSAALSRAIWIGAVLPDVFALHALITAAMCALSLHDRENPRRAFLLPALFFLGMANHHTTLFLAPLALEPLVTRGSRKKTLRPALTGAAVGAALCLALYASLTLLHPTSPFSWDASTRPARWPVTFCA
jgi:hypothetical protein